MRGFLSFCSGRRCKGIQRLLEKFMADRRIRAFCLSLSGSSLRNGGNRRRFFFRPLEAVMTSVVTLGVFLIPLIAVLISYDAFVGEQEHGTLILLFNLSALPTGAFNRQTSRAKCCTRRLPASWFFRIAAPYGIKCSAVRPHKT